MSKANQSEESWLDVLFKEEASGYFVQPENGSAANNGSVTPKFTYPVLLAEEPAPEARLKAYWKNLRAFFRSGKGGGLPAQDGRMLCFPALLAPYVATRQGGPYPCWVDTSAANSAKPVLKPVRQLVEQLIAGFAPGKNEARALKDNLLRLQLIIDQKIAGHDKPVPPQPLLEEALDELVLQLGLKGAEGDAFLADINQLRKLLPASGLVMPQSPCAPFHALAVLLGFQAQRQASALKEITAPLIARLRQLLAVEREKDPAAHSAASLEANMDFAGSFLNFEELASLLPTGGSVIMPAERLQRLEQVLQTLESAASTLYGQKPAVVVARRLVGRSGIDVHEVLPTANVEVVTDEAAFERITNLFDQKMQEASMVFTAIRTARLELDDLYQHDLHGDLFAHFTHADFSEAEMALCPPFILAVHSAALTHFGLNDFSSLLASKRPVKCLALRFDALGHVAPPDKSGKTEPVFRQEPAALAVAHRDTYVLQTSIADPAKLLEGLWEGIENPAPAFFYILSYSSRRVLPGGGLVWASSALSGREFPAFCYDIRKGPKWGSRFHLANNPGTDKDWPEETLLYTAADGAVQHVPTPFTFADFAALDPDFGRFFNLVPAACWTEELIPLAEYIQLPATEVYSKVPFVWMVDADNRLQKAAVALPLVQTCLERLDFWHFLQENAGIHSFHVEQATEQLQRVFDEQMVQKLAELAEAHAREIEQVREESARTALERVADFLLDLDVSSVAPATPAPAAPTTAAPAQKETPKAEEAPAPKAAVPEPATPEENLLLGEAWVETPLCTTCNECINLNDRIFKYNSEKQAYVANPAGGPFADIVKAAENCPVAIIHPGAPLNPKEAGLDALVKRAAKFN